MNTVLNFLVVGLALSNLALLGCSRLHFYIRAVAFQGFILGFFPLLAHGGVTPRLLLLAVGTAAIKGVLFPRLLGRIARDVAMQREVTPYVGYGSSLALGIVGLVLSFWLASRLPLTGAAATVLAPVSFFTILCGFLVIVTRRQAVTQVLGYIVLENGIYTFGAALVPDTPLLVELGVLLDVFVAVFVMGITIFHISREVEHVDTDQLSALRD